ncbi:PTS sugar transporter subunit IIA [Ligilactobacillus apodemi]|uniref:PTS sugar transporter subunit IIA n=1 Tax=Ligilactobacillus apodemi TaxID=307126 RepID=UPI00214B744D|nr:PTS glucose transporter subunit IIA [Ligilactobacillus apodemi]MCR1900672.1 PTS glucose transporter subunit IIA [Ligilactobacillus apodemi]
MFGLKKKKIELTLPVTGEIIDLSQVDDEVFSQGIMGQGFAVKPTENEIYAPVTGTITSVFPTKHAIGILTKQGVELLLHLGLGTVELAGTTFETLVTVGQEVDPETKLCEMDQKQIIEAGKSNEVLVLVTSGEEVTMLANDVQPHGTLCASVKIK